MRNAGNRTETAAQEDRTRKTEAMTNRVAPRKLAACYPAERDHRSQEKIYRCHLPRDPIERVSPVLAAGLAGWPDKTNTLSGQEMRFARPYRGFRNGC
jgi:hypothetical protein